jgi:hypothetical protein
MRLRPLTIRAGGETLMHHAEKVLPPSPWPDPPGDEARIRREIARLEAAYAEASEAGLKIARNAAARALRWALDGGAAPSAQGEGHGHAE